MTRVASGVIERFVRAARAIAREGLVRGASGNLSWRIDDDRVLVTATGAWLGELDEADVVVCDASGAAVDAGRPTMEVGLHVGTLRRRPDASVVLHFQSPAATAVACGPALELAVIPEVPYHLGPVARVAYHTPGTPELAEAVGAALADHDAALLESHGAVVVGADLRAALQRAITLELACEIRLRSDAVKPLPAEAVEALRAMRGEGRGV